MRTDFLKSLDLDDETIAKIQAEAGKDVTAEKEKTKAATDQAASLAEQIRQLKDQQSDSEALTKKVAELQATVDEQERIKAESAKEAAQKSRFEAVAKGKEFTNDYTKSGIYSDFAAAITDEKNADKSDAEFFESLTKDKGVFKNPNPAVSIAGVSDGVQTPDTSKSAFVDVIQKFKR